MSEPPAIDRMLRRLVVALGAHSRDEAALTMAAQLARKLDAELSGLFVEDADLFDIAALPVTSLLVHDGLRRRVLDTLSIERCYRVQEQNLRRLLATVSERHRVTRWSLDVRRGRSGEELVRNLGPDDLLVIGPRGHEERRRRLGEVLARETVHATLILEPGRWRAHRHIAVLHEGPKSALSAAARLAAALEARLSVIPVVVGEGAPTADDRAVQDFVKRWQGPVDIAEPVSGDPESLRGALERLGPDIVAMAREGPILMPIDTDTMDAIIGPCAVLFAGRANRTA